jgi:hypothetical protein
MEKVNFSKLLHTMFERHVMMRNSWANNITQLTLLLCISISKSACPQKTGYLIYLASKLCLSRNLRACWTTRPTKQHMVLVRIKREQISSSVGIVLSW